MSERKKNSLCKPPIPSRPKNLVVLNSKHLPKPPETFLTENVSNMIKDLNLDEKDKNQDKKKNKMKNSGQRFENSDSEEDNYIYLEPESLSATDFLETNVNEVISSQKQHKKSVYDENSKIGGSRKKFNCKNGLVSCEASEVDEPKHQILHPQWQRPLPSLPLPPVETKSVVVGMPWYRNVDRKKGEEILANGVDGYFLVRPSSNPDTYLTLTLWHNTRVYNIPIRKRKDGKFALGTPKTHEQCFESVECLVKNYQSEKLVLCSNGVQTGKTLLTTYPHPGKD